MKLFFFVQKTVNDVDVTEVAVDATVNYASLPLVVKSVYVEHVTVSYHL